MSNDLIQKNAELGKFLFCERYTLQPVKNSLYIAKGQDLKRGAVVDVNGYLIGTECLQPYAVLENDCDTRFGGKQTSVFIVGEFNFDKLFFADGLSKEQLDNIVYNARKIGIIIKPYSFSLDFVPQDDYKPENFEKAKKYAKYGDAIYADSLGNIHVIDGKSLNSSTIPEGWEFVGPVYKRIDNKAKILYKNENESVKWANCWLFRVEGLTFPLTSAVSIVMQQGPATGNTPVEVGTYTSSEGVASLDDFVDDLDDWLRDNPTASGALSNYGWHASKMKDANGNDACFIVVDKIDNQSRFSPIKSSTSGASAPLYMWQWINRNVDTLTIKRRDGVNTTSVVWNKERFKVYNTNVNNPTDSLTTTGLFNEEGFNATTTIKAYYVTYDNYLDNMMPDESATTGAYGIFKGIGKEDSEKLNSVKYTPIGGTETNVFGAVAYAESRKAHSTASVEGLNAGDFYMPSISENYEIFSQMKTDGTDPVNATLVKALGAGNARQLSVARWSLARWSVNALWFFYSSGCFDGYGLMQLSVRSNAIALYDLDD